MGLGDKLKNLTHSARKLRRSLGPDSYFQYKRRRDYERKEEEHQRERAQGRAEQEREEAARGRGYEARYSADRERDIARERTERAEKTEPDR
jgi:hypothetical protein